MKKLIHNKIEEPEKKLLCFRCLNFQPAINKRNKKYKDIIQRVCQNCGSATFYHFEIKK